MSALTPDPEKTIPPEEADDHEFHCRKCKEPVNYGVEKCPECGYGGLGHRMLAKYRIIAYQFSVIGCYLLILGIPLAKYPKKWRDAWKARYEMGVAEPDR